MYCRLRSPRPQKFDLCIIDSTDEPLASGRCAFSLVWGLDGAAVGAIGDAVAERLSCCHCLEASAWSLEFYQQLKSMLGVHAAVVQHFDSNEDETLIMNDCSHMFTHVHT